MNKTLVIIIFLMLFSNSFSQRTQEPKLRFGFNYGLNSLNNKEFDLTLNKSGSYGVNFGNSFCMYKREDIIVPYFLSSLGFEYYKDKYYLTKEQNNSFNYSALKLFMNINIAIGYNLGKVRIYPFFSAPYSFSWIKYYNVDNVNNYQIKESDENILKKYDGSFRYGRMREGGIILGLGKIFDIKLSFDRSMYYPRHLGLQEQLSTMIENSIVLSLLATSYPIIMVLPEWSGIYNFVIQNAISFVFSELRKDKQYWPFASDRPLYFDTFRLELGFNIGVPAVKNMKH